MHDEADAAREKLEDLLERRATAYKQLLQAAGGCEGVVHVLKHKFKCAVSRSDGASKTGRSKTPTHTDPVSR